MKVLKSFGSLVNPQMIIIVFLSILATHLCIQYNITADFPLTIIGIAVVFPIVFSINGAYRRREKALDQYAVLKSHGRGLYYATRDWVKKDTTKTDTQFKKLMQNFFDNCKTLFHSTPAEYNAAEKKVYHSFSELSHFIQDLRANDLSSGEVSRANSFLVKMMSAFENLKHIHQYRTPKTLRSYSRIFITVLPVLYGPHFAGVALDSSPMLWFILPLLFSVVLVSLDNIQDFLEDPFDQDGEDDLMINSEKFTQRLDY